MRLDGFFQFLGSAEGNLLAGLDLDGFAGGRIAAHTGGALTDLQNTETREAKLLALLQMLGDHFDKLVEQSFALLLAHFVAFSERMSEMLESDGTTCFRGGRRLLFDSHLIASLGARNAPTR